VTITVTTTETISLALPSIPVTVISGPVSTITVIGALTTIPFQSYAIISEASDGSLIISGPTIDSLSSSVDASLASPAPLPSTFIAFLDYYANTITANTPDSYQETMVVTTTTSTSVKTVTVTLQRPLSSISTKAQSSSTSELSSFQETGSVSYDTGIIVTRTVVPIPYVQSSGGRFY
jgi:hypothetical protein